MTVSRAHPDDMLLIWPQIQPLIQRCLKKGLGETLTEPGLWAGVMTGGIDLWVVSEGVEVKAGLFLQTVRRERGKALIILAAVANERGKAVEHTKELLPLIREYADMIGAYTVEACARLGTARILKRLGCKPKAIVMELKDGR